VLVVDDERSIRELCRINLEFEEFEVVEAPDGVAAVEQARRHRPDLILLDLMMPGMDGWGVLDELQRDPTTAEIPVVLLTAKGDELDQIHAWEHGVFDYVLKPFNPLELGEWAARAMAPRDPEVEAERRRRMVEHLRRVRETRPLA
jgi:DNA-binding response OmpR family regulator